MRIHVNTPTAVVVSLSERNLRGLLGTLEGRGLAVKWHLTERGAYLTVVAEPDAVHYADRPDGAT